MIIVVLVTVVAGGIVVVVTMAVLVVMMMMVMMVIVVVDRRRAQWRGWRRGRRRRRLHVAVVGQNVVHRMRTRPLQSVVGCRLMSAGVGDVDCRRGRRGRQFTPDGRRPNWKRSGTK